MFALERTLVAGQKLVVGVLMAAAFLAVVLMVPARYFALRLPDLSEIGLIGIATLTFLCIGLLVRTGGHISIEVAALVSSKRLRFFLRQVVNAGILLFVGLFGAQALLLLESVMSSREATLSLGIPLTVPFGALVVGLLFAAFHTVMNVVRDVRVLRTPDAVFAMGEDAEEVLPE